MLTAAAYAVTFAVLVAAVAYTVWDERRQARRRQARRHTCSQDDVDRLAAECRESEPGHQNHAWPPGTTTPPAPAPAPPAGAELDAWAAEWEARYQL